jgi:exonuclease SbcC
MSYDTFLNSAYLKQGRADEFVRQTANRRKEILSDILELSRYDRLEEKAKHCAKEAADNIADVERQANMARAVAADAQRYRADLSVEEAHISSLHQEHALLVETRRKAELRSSELNSQLSLRESLASQLKGIDTELNSVHREQQDTNSRIHRLQLIVNDRGVITADYRRLQEGRVRAIELAAKIRELHQVEIALLTVKNSLASQEQALQSKIANLRKDVANGVANKQAAEKLSQEITALTISQNQFDHLQDDFIRLDALKTELTTTVAELRLEHDQFDKAIKDEAARQIRLQDQVENCSLCGSPLPPERIDKLLYESKQMSNALIEKKDKVKALGIAARRKLNETSASLVKLEHSRTELAALSSQRIRLDQQFQQAVAAAASLESNASELETMLKMLAESTFGESERQELVRLQSIYAVLSPLRAEHKALEQDLARLAGVEPLYQELMSADNNLAAEARTLVLLNKHADSLSKQHSELFGDYNRMEGIENRLKAADSDLKTAAANEQNNARKISDVQNLIGRLQRSIEQCADAEERVKLLEAQRDQYKNTESLYKVLTAAFGKRGIQASIIEGALPELEEYTNNILNRLTDGDLRVFIETTRQAKAKNASLVETLEIKISDSLGTRPLEMYSGGEAFRVSFALRIALSMLLVRRSGADLQTLIIDEGFGTQDAKGREKLIDAINAIKQDFDQIMVITHIEELKEAFATRIEVYKTSEGSQLRIVHGDAIG